MSHLSVLIAEDNDLVVETLTGYLSRMGHTVVGVAADGTQAVAMADELQPDIILMDIKMPQLDGISAAGEIRSRHSIPVIIITGHADVALASRAAEAHVAAYLVKPVRADDLAPALEVAMAQQQRERELTSQVDRLSRRLESRVLVERAKGVLMEIRGLSERAAYEEIRLQARRERLRIEELAARIIAQHEEDTSSEQSAPAH